MRAALADANQIGTIPLSAGLARTDTSKTDGTGDKPCWGKL